MALALRAGLATLQGGNLEHPLKLKRRLVVRFLGLLLCAARRVWSCAFGLKGIHGSSSISFQTGLRQFNGATARGDSVSACARSLIGEVNVGRLGCRTHVVDDNTAGAIPLQDRRE